MTVVLLHALPLDPRMWEPNEPALEGHRTVRPRLYDYDGSLDERAGRILEEVAGRLVLVGASFGGYVALAAAKRAPERVAGLLLAGSRADADDDERRAGREDTIRTAREGGIEAVWEKMRDRLFAPATDPDPALVERARAIAFDRGPEEIVRAVEAIREREDTRDVLAGLGSRALVVLGDDDPYVSPGDVEEARDVVVLPKCGHLPNMQRATDFNEILRGALERWT